MEEHTIEIRTLATTFTVEWEEDDTINGLKTFIKKGLQPTDLPKLFGVDNDGEMVVLEDTDLMRDVVKKVSYLSLVIDKIQRKREIDDKDHSEIIKLLDRNNIDKLAEKLNEFEKVIICEHSQERKNISNDYMGWYRYKVPAKKPVFPAIIDLSAVKYYIKEAKTNVLKALKGNPLTHIGFSNWIGVSPGDITLLLEALEDNNVLSVLEIKNVIRFNKEAFQQLMVLLDNQKPLIELNLRNYHKHGLDDDDASVIASALQMNHTLKVLNLENSNITQEGARVLCMVLSQNHTLEKLFLSDNRREPYSFRNYKDDFNVEELADLIGDRPIPITISVPNVRSTRRQIEIKNITFEFPNLSW